MPRPPKPQRRPANLAEAAFFDAATSAGWECWRRGWPDFFIRRDGKIAAVEVKPRSGYRLKVYQRAVMLALAEYGVPCYQWTPDGGFVRILTR